MLISKSLFVERCSYPKRARWMLNDKITYTMINQARYGDMDGAAIGQSVEDLVKELFADMTMVSIDGSKVDFKDRHASYHRLTMDAIASGATVIYQPGFLVETLIGEEIVKLFVKCDFLVRQDDGRYRIYEVKAKNTIRKENSKKELSDLKDDLRADVSFQRYVASKALGDHADDAVTIIHLNKYFVKNGPVDPGAILTMDDVSENCLGAVALEETIATMMHDLTLSEQIFNERYPFMGSEYFSHFAKEPEKGSIFTIPRLGNKCLPLLAQGKTMIDQLNEDDIIWLYNSKGEESEQSRYVRARQIGEDCVAETLQPKIADRSFPLVFYDYETISTPIPLLEWTSPRQQVVVQYSIHVIHQDGTNEHYEDILQSGEQTNERIVASLTAIAARYLQSSFVVWYQWFEKSRNDEMATAYPAYAPILQQMNTKTVDLMETVSQMHYFHRGFGGSSSIKKVLPVLTGITYDDLDVHNGAQAQDLLIKLISWSLQGMQADLISSQLLTYCKQDTRAMVRIWEELRGKIHNE